MRPVSRTSTITLKGGSRGTVPAERSAESCVEERGIHDGSDGDSHS